MKYPIYVHEMKIKQRKQVLDFNDSCNMLIYKSLKDIKVFNNFPLFHSKKNY